MGGNIAPKLETLYVHEQISQLLSASVIISKILVMRMLQSMGSRHMGFSP